MHWVHPYPPASGTHPCPITAAPAFAPVALSKRKAGVGPPEGGRGPPEAGTPCAGGTGTPLLHILWRRLAVRWR